MGRTVRPDMLATDPGIERRIATLERTMQSMMSMLDGLGATSSVQWGTTTLNLNSTATPTSPGITILDMTQIGGVDFATQVDMIVGNVVAGGAWPTYYGFEPGYVNGNGNNKIVIALVSGGGASVSMTITWIAIGH